MSEPATNNPDPATAALARLRTKLLDLTARNRLIHYPHGREGNLRIVGPAPNLLFQRLLNEKELRFQAVPDPTRDELIDGGYLEIEPQTGLERELHTPPNAAEWAKRKGLASDYEVPSLSDPEATDDDKKLIQTLHYPVELETRLRGLRNRAETAIEETGANICYVTFGFLEWFDAPTNGTARHAPLVMVPVRINKARLNPQTGTYDYTIAYTGEDILPNLSFKAKLNGDFGLGLPDLDSETQPEAYWDQVTQIIKVPQPRWRVHRWLTTGLLSFSKILMYRDLDPDNWPSDRTLTKHPKVRRLLIAETSAGAGMPAGAASEHPIDDLPEVHERYPLIDDADSSQHSALVDALDGEDLVIEGPPGTGKSQTITNLIAAALAQGKRVLFVAEKLAALEVVKAKLEKAGLGTFCLELHGHKTQKRRVLDDIGARLNQQGTFASPASLDTEIARYEGLKENLRRHAERVNSPWRNTGFTIHQILTAATRHREALGIDPSGIHPEGIDGTGLNPATRSKAQQSVRVFADVQIRVRQQLGSDATLAEHPWYGVDNRALLPFDAPRVCTGLDAWQSALIAVRDALATLAQTLGEGDDSPLWQRAGIESLRRDLRALPVLRGDEIMSALALLHGDKLRALSEQLDRLAAIRDYEQALNAQLNGNWRDPSGLPNRLAEASAWFSGLGVSGGTSLAALATAHGQLEKLLKLLEQFGSHMAELAKRLPPDAAALLQPTIGGIKEWRGMFDVIGQLRTGLLQYRGDWCEDDALDGLLPTLEDKLTKLKNARAKLGQSFALERLPEPAALALLRDTLARPGLFRWLNREWRAARRGLLDLARFGGSKPPLRILRQALDLLCRYAEAKVRLEQKPRYRTALGPHFVGLETPIADLLALRAWYRAVRERYGVGFGSRVALGDALIGMEASLIKAMQSLAAQGVGGQIDAFLEQFAALRLTFPLADDPWSDTAVLPDPKAGIAAFRVALATRLGVCQPGLTDPNATLDDIAALLDRLHQRDALLRDWLNSPIDPAWFGDTIDLCVPPGQLTPAAVATATNTLALAQAVDTIESAWLRAAIRRQPTAALFASLRALSEQLTTAAQTSETQRAAFSVLVTLDMDHWCQRAGTDLPGLLARNQRALDNPNWLGNWLDFLRARDALATLGFGRLAAAIEAGVILIEHAEDGFHLAIFDLLAREILTNEPALATFSGGAQTSLQEQYRECDQGLQTLQRQRLAARIAANPVDPGTVGARAAGWTGQHLLEKEFKKQKAHIPLRQLIDRAGTALAALKPCFMMGPMSVAQYLKAGAIEFDLVVMDEASQMRPEDALGAVARGKQLVVVGDPKQLPPTNFFQTIGDGDDDDDLAVQTAESILDAALPLFPAGRLRWHYRSRHESLIAFSNHHFYDDDLVVFPSPNADSPDYGVKFTRVAGACFVNNRNHAEAEAIAKAVCAHLCGFATASIGVVAMNAPQRERIEQAIESLAKEDALFRDRLEANRNIPEPLFIKNLENVQGDERDVILISGTYGPQAAGGPVPQRFGPINSETGWRRLNVLFTRAKERMHIFASMGAADILVSAQSKRGVADFRDFLAFAETGTLHQAVVTGRPPDSDFEIAVAAALGKAGFECVPQVGAAGFFIDIAVRDPGCPGRYLMGIECDGATYHSAKSVRDRDRLRQAILEQLGWQIRRIWSTDWYRNPAAELQPIIAQLHALRTTKAPVVEFALTPRTRPAVAPTPGRDDESARPLEAARRTRVGRAPRRQPAPAPAQTPRQLSLLPEQPQGAPPQPAVSGLDLRERLLRFDQDVIRPTLPDTPEDRRLLRPPMVAALLKHRPVSKSEFQESIPTYLRQQIAATEGHWLADVLQIVAEAETEGCL